MIENKLTTALTLFFLPTCSFADVFTCAPQNGAVVAISEARTLGSGGQLIIDTERGIRSASGEHFGECTFYDGASFSPISNSIWSCVANPVESALGAQQVTIRVADLYFSSTIANPDLTIAQVGRCIKI